MHWIYVCATLKTLIKVFHKRFKTKWSKLKLVQGSQSEGIFDAKRHKLKFLEMHTGFMLQKDPPTLSSQMSLPRQPRRGAPTQRSNAIICLRAKTVMEGDWQVMLSLPQCRLRRHNRTLSGNQDVRNNLEKFQPAPLGWHLHDCCCWTELVVRVFKTTSVLIFRLPLQVF